MKKTLSIIILFFAINLQCLANETDTFNLAGVIENIINYQEKTEFISEIQLDSRENFLYATKNLYNGNVVVAYLEFLKTIDSLDKNFSLLMVAKKLYEYGFFSLGDRAISKISGVDKMQSQINELKEAYKPSYELNKDEETYLVKAYTSIYYNNSPEEVAFNLIKKNILLENSDYANFIMAKSMFECRQYVQALIYVDKAIEKNNKNSNYKLFKAQTLFAHKKYKEALKYIEQNEKDISIFLSQDFKILKQQILSNLSTDEMDKRFYQIYSYYLAGNYYKTIKETQNILNFIKNNPKILTLQAMAYLALGEFENAKKDFELSYKINKKFDLTIMGMADCDFKNENYKEAYKKYKKLFKTNLKQEAILKAEIALSNLEKQEKKITKLNKQKQLFENRTFFEYYTIANSLFDDSKLKKKYTAKALSLNVLYINTWDILLEEDYKDKKFDNLEKLVFMLSFLDLKNPEYYYYTALALENKDFKKEAFYEVKKAININPDYKPAIDLMNKLQNELI